MKKFLIIIAILLGLVLTTALVVPMLLQGKIGEVVKREANGMLNAKLDFKSLDVSLLRHFPHASLEIQDLSLVGVAAFEGDTIVSAARISVVVNLMSLFGDEGFEVTKVLLKAPSLRAHKLIGGEVNWDVMKPTEELPDSTQAAPSAFKLAVRNVRIEGAALRYVDDSSHIQFRTSNAALLLRGNFSARQTDLDLRLVTGPMRLVSGGVPWLNDAEAELKAVIQADLEQNRFTFAHNTLRLNAIELSLDGWAALADDAIDMDIRAVCDKVQFREVLSMIPAFYTRDFNNLTAEGELSLSAWVKGRQQKSLFPAFDIALSVKDGSFKYSSLPKSVTDINITAGISSPGGGLDGVRVDLSRFGLTMAGNTLQATLQASNIVSDLHFDLSADGKIDLGAIRQVYPLPEGVTLAGLISANVKAIGRLSDVEAQRYEGIQATGQCVVEGMQSTMEGLPTIKIRRAAATITPSAMILGELGVSIGRSELMFNGQLTDYIGYLLRGDRLSGRLYVKSALLDLNEMMETTTPTKETDAIASQAEQPAAAISAIEVPDNLNLSLNVDLKRVLFQKMEITDLVGEMSVVNSELLLNKLRMNMLGGAVDISGLYSTATDPQHPDMRLTMGIANASFATTFKELDMVGKLVPLFAKTGGNYSMSLELAARLDETMSPDLQTLNAAGQISSENIRLQNIEVLDKLAKAIDYKGLNQGEAKTVLIKFTVKDGRITTQPFDLKMGGVTLNLSGSTGLDQSIDYLAQVNLPHELTGGAFSSLPVTIGGTFSAPKIELGVKSVAKEAITKVVNKELEKLTGSKNLNQEIERQAVKIREQTRLAGEKLVAAATEQKVRLMEKSKSGLAKFAAEKAGDKLIKEAEKQAAKLQTEAEKQIEQLKAKSK